MPIDCADRGHILHPLHCLTRDYWRHLSLLVGVGQCLRLWRHAIDQDVANLCNVESLKLGPLTVPVRMNMCETVKSSALVLRISSFNYFSVDLPEYTFISCHTLLCSSQRPVVGLAKSAVETPKIASPSRTQAYHILQHATLTPKTCRLPAIPLVAF